MSRPRGRLKGDTRTSTPCSSGKAGSGRQIDDAFLLESPLFYLGSTADH